MAARGRRRWMATTRDDNQGNEEVDGGQAGYHGCSLVGGHRACGGTRSVHVAERGPTKKHVHYGIAAKDPSTGRRSLWSGDHGGRTGANDPNRQRSTRQASIRIKEDRFLIGRNLSLFSEPGTYQWTCSLVGADVVKFPAYSEKSEDVGKIERGATCAPTLV